MLPLSATALLVLPATVCSVLGRSSSALAPTNGPFTSADAALDWAVLAAAACCVATGRGREGDAGKASQVRTIISCTTHAENSECTTYDAMKQVLAFSSRSRCVAAVRCLAQKHVMRTFKSSFSCASRCAVDVTLSICSFSAVDVGTKFPTQNEYASICNQHRCFKIWCHIRR